MKTFFPIFRLELVLYRRSVWIWLSVFLLTGYLYLGYNAFLSENIEVGQFLQSSGYIGMVAAIIGLLMGILNARREKVSGFSETLDAVPGDNVRGLAKISAWSVIALLFSIIAAVEIILMVLYVHSEFIEFSGMLFKYIFLYWGMTLLSSGYLGYAIAKLFSSVWLSLFAAFVVWILISPINAYMVLLVPQISELNGISKVLFYLNQGESDLESAYREVQGLNVSSDVWMKKLSFYLLSLFFFLVTDMRPRGRGKLNQGKRTHHYKVAGCFVVLILTIVTAKSPFDQSTALDYETYYGEKDRIHYGQVEKIDSNSAESRYFQIQAYDMDLTTLNDQIKYSLKMSAVSEDTNKKWLTFTLYHGIKVNDVKVNDEAADWYRSDDLLFIEDSKREKAVEISLQAVGNVGGLHVLKGNSFFLTSDFPWLPVAGAHQVAGVSDENGQFNYNSILLGTESDYRIKVNNSRKVFSNLPEISPGVFEGKAKGFSLLSGVLLEENTNSIKSVHPPDRLKNVEPFLLNLQEQVNEVSSLLGVNSINLKKELKSISVIPYYSYENTNRMKYRDGELYLNEKFGRGEYIGTLNLSSVFYGFFWQKNPSDYNAFILSALIEYVASPDTPSTLTLLVEDIERQGTEAAPVQYFFKDVRRIYEEGKEKEIKLLIQEMYKNMNERVLSLDDWNEKLSRIVEEGAASDE